MTPGLPFIPDDATVVAPVRRNRVGRSSTPKSEGRTFATLLSEGNPKLPETLDLLLRGMVAGFAISAPVGPVNVMCVSRTLSGGPKGGLTSGLGAAVSDTIYG